MESNTFKNTNKIARFVTLQASHGILVFLEGFRYCLRSQCRGQEFDPPQVHQIDNGGIRSYKTLSRFHFRGLFAVNHL